MRNLHTRLWQPGRLPWLPYPACRGKGPRFHPTVPTFFLCSLDVQVCLPKAALSPAFLLGCWACLSSHRGAILSPSLPPVHWTPSPPFHASSCCSRGRCPIPTLLSLSRISLQVAPPSSGPWWSLSALSPPSTLSCFSFLFRVCAPSLPPLDFSLVLLFLQEAPLGFPSPPLPWSPRAPGRGPLPPLPVEWARALVGQALLRRWGSAPQCSSLYEERYVLPSQTLNSQGSSPVQETHPLLGEWKVSSPLPVHTHGAASGHPHFPVHLIH